ncbi:hypothetical protein RJJ65_39615, partial [Rhizobium hidalgonense]
YTNTEESQKIQLKQLIIAVGQALDEGHTCLLINQHSLKFDQLQHAAIVDEQHAKTQPAPLVRAGDYVYFYRQWQQENQLAEQLTRILKPVRPVSVQFDDHETANPLQQQAIRLAGQHAFSLIT